MESKKPKILVVEDDAFLVEIHQNKLSKAGLEVIFAEDGEKAIKMAKKDKPDLILLDLIMPVKDGFETLKELKTDPDLKDIKVIILSNLSQEEDKKKVMEMGAIDYMVKANVSFREVLELIKKHL